MGICHYCRGTLVIVLWPSGKSLAHWHKRKGNSYCCRNSISACSYRVPVWRVIQPVNVFKSLHTDSSALLSSVMSLINGYLFLLWEPYSCHRIAPMTWINIFLFYVLRITTAYKYITVLNCNLNYRSNLQISANVIHIYIYYILATLAYQQS